MSSLFVTLGTSPAIVPEAFLLPGVRFESVHVLTTEKPDVSLLQRFFQDRAPDVHLAISRVDGFVDFASEADHFHFEEVLYRWIIEANVPRQQRYICLSGGFKTMSAAMQKAAAVLGAAEVFHVLADNCCTNAKGEPCPPSSIDEILKARDQGHLHWIRLGPEGGWPQFQQATSAEFPLRVVKQDNGVRWLRAPDEAFCIRLREIVERSHNIAGAWDKLPRLPFPVLATWPGTALAWLEQPLDLEADRDWVARLPKLELHCHLGGFATRGPLLDQVRAAAAQPDKLPPLKACTPPEGWPLPHQPIKLADYMRLGDNGGSAVLKDAGCLRRHCELLYHHLLDQNVIYAEIRCSPANYTNPHRSPWQVLCDIRQHFQDCMDWARSASNGPFCHVNLILIATRRTEGDYRAQIARHLALAVAAAEHWTNDADCRVVGVDLAGYEDVNTRAHYFRDEFTGVHRCGLAVTVHAGENDEAEGIWRAVFDLNARRLGHALHLAQSPDLMRSVAARGIGVEMCPYANYQIKGYPLDPQKPSAPSDQPRPYPLLSYLRAGLRVTVNTDNIGISAASLTDNLLLAARLCPGLTRLDLLWLQRHAMDTAFVSPRQRDSLLTAFAQKLAQP